MTLGPGPGGFGAPVDPGILQDQADARIERYDEQADAAAQAKQYRKTHPGRLRRLFRRRKDA